jgi:predicted amidohydrolase
MTEREDYGEVTMMALSAKNTPSIENVQTLLNQIERPNTKNALLVLPEYFLRGANPFDPVKLTDPRISYLEKYANIENIHLVLGAILENEGRKTLSALFISPQRGLIKEKITSKMNPTSFESKNGITAVPGNFPVLNFDNSELKLTIVDCFDLWKEDLMLRMQMHNLGVKAPQIIAHMRGFDLDDSRFGNLSEKWTSHLADICTMTKSYGVAATGITEENKGSISEIINFEGDILERIDGGLAKGKTNLELQQTYREQKYISKTVARF